MIDDAVAQQEPVEGSEAYINEALARIDAIVLRGLLYQLTGDESVAAVPHTIEIRGHLGEVSVIKDPEHVAFLRAKAVAFLKSYLESGSGEIPLVEQRLHRSLELTAGSRIAESELEMWIEQSAFDPMARGYEWPQQPTDEQRENFFVAVIGTGMGGLNCAVHLKRAGMPFVVIEKNEEVGGTWWENRYPGARLDTVSRTYFHSFGANYPLPGPYAVQAHNERYMKWVADNFALRSDIVFKTEVTSVTWDEEAQLWTIHAKGPEGARTWRANAVISAVGFLNRPNIPNIEGSDTFKGQILHTAKWHPDTDTRNKRIAVIGSGATSYQMVPELAKQSGHVTLFQRTPSWCLEVPGYLNNYPPQVHWLDRNFPYLVNFLRFQLSWMTRPESAMPRLTIEPGFDDPFAVSPVNKRIRDASVAFMRRELGDREDLFEKMLPSAPVFTSRPILVDSDDNIFDALLRDNVELVTEPIERITPTGIRTKDGRDHDFDIIVYATGYKANEFLWPMDVRGRDGRTIEQLWAKDGARAYMGVMMPGFPNFFVIYGPNMNPFGNGLGVIEAQELTARFALNCIGGLILKNRRSVDVKTEAFDRYNEALDVEESMRVYADPRATSYYRTEFNRSACNCPFDVRLLWNWMRDPADGTYADRSDPVVRAYFGADLVVD